MKTFITLLLFLPLPVLAETSFEELFDIDPGKLSNLANRVSQYHTSDSEIQFSKAKQLLQSTTAELELLLTQQPDNPLLWFLLGLNYNNLASLHFAIDPAATQQYIAKKLNAYEQAMISDNAQKPVLTAAIYATMKHALPLDKKITAIQQELSLGGNGDNESYYWYLHWSNIHNLTQAGRFDEARKAALQLEKELRASGLSNSDYQAIARKAQAGIEQAQRTTDKAQPSVTKQQQPEEKSNLEPYQKLVSMNQILWIVVILLVFLLLAALLYEKRSRKR